MIQNNEQVARVTVASATPVPLRVLYVVLGTVFLAVGVIGVFLPGLPTTPFLLLTAALYVRSSDRLHQRLMQSRVLGGYIRDFQEHGLSMRGLYISLAMMWSMVLLSSYLLRERPWVAAVVIAAGGVGSIVMTWVAHRSRDTRSE